jgi:hypothetical protein
MKSTKNQTNNFTIFDWLKEINYNKSPWSKFSDEHKKSFEPYMINRFLSMNKDYIELVNYVQTTPYSEKEKYYKIYCNFLPKKQFWSKYIKAEKSNINDELIKHISFYFECASKDAIDYIDLLNKDQLKEILSGLGIEDKEIKKLLK